MKFYIISEKSVKKIRFFLCAVSKKVLKIGLKK